MRNLVASLKETVADHYGKLTLAIGFSVAGYYIIKLLSSFATMPEGTLASF